MDISSYVHINPQQIIDTKSSWDTIPQKLMKVNSSSQTHPQKMIDVKSSSHNLRKKLMEIKSLWNTFQKKIMGGKFIITNPSSENDEGKLMSKHRFFTIYSKKNPPNQKIRGIEI